MVARVLGMLHDRRVAAGQKVDVDRRACGGNKHEHRLTWFSTWRCGFVYQSKVDEYGNGNENGFVLLAVTRTVHTCHGSSL